MPVPSTVPSGAVVALADRGATRRLARRLAPLLHRGDVIGLGPLLPAVRLDNLLEHGPTPDARVARIAAHGAWIERLPELVDG